jgi:hypothetical protein
MVVTVSYVRTADWLEEHELSVAIEASAASIATQSAPRLKSVGIMVRLVKGLDDRPAPHPWAGRASSAQCTTRSGFATHDGA